MLSSHTTNPTALGDAIRYYRSQNQQATTDDDANAAAAGLTDYAGMLLEAHAVHHDLLTIDRCASNLVNTSGAESNAAFKVLLMVMRKEFHQRLQALVSQLKKLLNRQIRTTNPGATHQQLQQLRGSEAFVDAWSPFGELITAIRSTMNCYVLHETDHDHYQLAMPKTQRMTPPHRRFSQSPQPTTTQQLQNRQFSVDDPELREGFALIDAWTHLDTEAFLSLYCTDEELEKHLLAHPHLGRTPSKVANLRSRLQRKKRAAFLQLKWEEWWNHLRARRSQQQWLHYCRIKTQTGILFGVIRRRATPSVADLVAGSFQTSRSE